MSAEPDYLPADALAEEEPKYLRRQKPVEIRERKFSRKTWPLYRRVLVGGIAALARGKTTWDAAFRSGAAEISGNGRSLGEYSQVLEQIVALPVTSL